MVKTKNNDVSSAKIAISNIIRSTNRAETEEVVIYAAYVEFLLCDMADDTDYNGFVKSLSPELVKHAVINVIDKGIFNKLKDINKSYSKDVYLELISTNNFKGSFVYQRNESTPPSVVELSHAILGIKEGENVADIGSGSGGFIIPTAIKYPKSNFTGYEIVTDKAAAATIRANCFVDNASIVIGDCFQTIEPSLYSTFDKAFANYPFAMRLDSNKYNKKLLEEFTSEVSQLPRHFSSEWVFNYLLSKLINKKGKAVGIMPNGCAWNGGKSDIAIRKYFVEKGLIEAVIALPGRLFYDTSIPSTMIVISHGNETVKIIDARETCTEHRRYNVFSKENINEITKALNKDDQNSTICKTLSKEELRNNDYTLSPDRYMEPKYQIDNGVKFGDVCKTITRGAHFSAKDLDGLTSVNPTPYQYLMLANIKDGIIDEDLQYISSISEKDEKYCIKNNSLLISKNGAPFKIAVATVSEDKTILANGNLYIINLDEEKANPYYIQAFFESEMGVALLKSITVGTTIPNIGVENLKNLMIPLPSLEEQERIAAEYQAAVDEVKILRQRLDDAVDRMKHIVDNRKEK